MNNKIKHYLNEVLGVVEYNIKSIPDNSTHITSVLSDLILIKNYLKKINEIESEMN